MTNKAAYTILILLFSASFAVSLYSSFPNWFSHPTIKTLTDFGHLPLFFITCLIISPIFKTYWPACWQIKSLLTAIGLAIAVELSQPFAGRESSIVDLYMGACGSLLAACLLIKLSTFMRLLSCLSILGLGLLPIAPELSLFAKEKSMFPDLMVIKPLELKWQPLPDEEAITATLATGPCISNPDHHCLSVAPAAKKWSGVRTKLRHMNWSGFQYLVVEIEVEQPAKLGFRIDDIRLNPSFKNRFNRDFDLNAGVNLFKIPTQEIASIGKHERLNMQKIHKLAIFTSPKKEPVKFHIKALYLE